MREPAAPVGADPPPIPWSRLIIASAAIFVLFDAVARALGSLRGEWGIVLALVVVPATLLADHWCAGAADGGPGAARADLRARLGRVGLGLPTRRGLLAATGLSLALLALVPVVAGAGGGRWRLTPDWLPLLPGLFAQAGIAEEALFRGFVFATVRRREPRFWRAAGLASLPFVVAHLALFATMAWPLALLSVLLAAALAFPFAHLYELGGRTIWGAALLHAVIQGTPKVLTVEPSAAAFGALWIGAAMVVSFGAFAVRRR